MITLLITIIVMLILVGISFNVLFDEDGIITKARLSTFANEMSNIKENVELQKSKHAAELLKSSADESVTDFNSTLFEKNLNLNEYDIKTSLKREILYSREGYPSDISIDSYEDEDFEDGVEIDKNGDVQGIYVLDKETADGNENSYLWDMQTDIVYKIKPTKIGKSVYHSYAIAALGINPTGAEVTYDLLIADEAQFIEKENISYYEPDLTGYSKSNTKIIYWSQDYLNNPTRALARSDYIELPVQEYIKMGKPAKLLGKNFPEDTQEKLLNQEYVFYDYENQVWGNVKTDANELECWWVWIPRYAYKINASNNTELTAIINSDGNPIDIKFINTENKIAKNQKLPDDYIAHSAFTTTGKNSEGKEESTDLKGIWMSKYEPSYTNDYVPLGSACYAPDMDGFDEENTYIELYDKKTESFGDQITLKNANLSTINTQYVEQDEIWYDYSNNIWANVKTKANDIECWWVWIPRYAYKIVDGVQETDIIFIDLKNRPIDKAKFGTSLPEGYEVHPAFIPSGEDGEKNLKGIWVSKYEPSFVAKEQVPISNLCYAPDMEGFDKENTYIEIYDSNGNAVVEEKLLKDVDLSTINAGNAWYDYSNQKWANIKTIANGIECWWVWIPRYAYVITDTSAETATNKITETGVVFVDTNNKPIDSERYGEQLQDCYVVHPAFTETETNDDGEEVVVKELKGIWMSKYEPSTSYTYDPKPISTKCYAPDMTGFDENNTYIEIYDSTGMQVQTDKEVLLKNADLTTINQDNKWYDYANQKWANIKTYNNSLECWWVWIPRYAYLITESQPEAAANKITETNIIFIDLDNKPIDKEKFGDTLPEGYIVHPAFTPSGSDGSKNLKGIWMSKYEPSWK